MQTWRRQPLVAYLVREPQAADGQQEPHANEPHWEQFRRIRWAKYVAHWLPIAESEQEHGDQIIEGVTKDAKSQ